MVWLNIVDGAGLYREQCAQLARGSWRFVAVLSSRIV